LFRGIHTLNLDSKGRIAIPTCYREKLLEASNGCVVTTYNNDQRCLLLFPSTVWDKFEAFLLDLPPFDPEARKLQRIFIGHAFDGQMDPQGRLLIPPQLRKKTNLERETVIVGVGRKFEIWEEGAWNAHCNVCIEEGGLKASNNEVYEKLNSAPF